MDKNSELRIGVIGCGGRGRLARHAHKPGQGSRLVAGCDIRPEALSEFQEFCGEDTFVCTDYRELLEQPGIDAVFVTTPDYWHEEHALAALDAGKAIYLEKPMTITTAGCDRVLEKARANGLKLFLGHNMRHMSFVQEMKKLIENGAIGEVKAGWCRHFVAYGGDAYFKDWHAERSKATSMLLQKGAHDIDVLHWLCGGYSRRVTALGNLTVYNQIEDRHDPSERGDASWRLENWPPLSQKGMNPVIDVEDLSMMNMELDNGVLCSYQQCHYSPDGWRNYTIIGTEGRVENLGDSPGSCVVQLWNKRCHYKADGDVQYPMEPVTGGHGGA
ncbi:MAG: Gfo/Idh/MocA family oxidoreductase, partial [Lentisphaerae bacterium]|nr:Gfo/Idh/MocA family oxidoreductase [Lentisphaerota bacterium]